MHARLVLNGCCLEDSTSQEVLTRRGNSLPFHFKKIHKAHSNLPRYQEEAEVSLWMLPGRTHDTVEGTQNKGPRGI